ncbi:electron transport complex subunit E [bacterium]|nr:electron transport complex subunit E [bacterium]
MSKKTYSKTFFAGFIKENPVLALALGLCPTLAVTTSLYNAIGMGIAATFVLVCSNAVISLFRKIIPEKIRIPIFIVVIATFVTIVDLSMSAFLPELHAQLGIFVPLIVVNCVILGRAEAFASKNGIIISIIDGLGMGIGFTLALSLIGIIRELFGNGTLFSGTPMMIEVFSKPAMAMIFAPGAFITMGFIMAFIASREKKEG